MSSSITSVAKEQMGGQDIELLSATEDRYGGFIVEMKEPMDSTVFVPRLKASISHWKQQGKKGVWIKLPLKVANLVEPAVKAGFRYHHAEPDYVMLVHWIPSGPDTLPANASHHVGIGAFVMNNNREVLVVKETDGKHRGRGVWKMPTGTVMEGEDISDAAIREVKEETGILTEFIEVLAFRQSHQSSFQKKSDMFFVCMLQPRSSDIQMQASEIEAAKWMPIEDYAAQHEPKNGVFDLVAKICLAKLDGNYTGFTPLATTTTSGKKTYLYFNHQDASHLLNSD